MNKFLRSYIKGKVVNANADVSNEDQIMWYMKRPYLKDKFEKLSKEIHEGAAFDTLSVEEKSKLISGYRLSLKRALLEGNDAE